MPHLISRQVNGGVVYSVKRMHAEDPGFGLNTTRHKSIYQSGNMLGVSVALFLSFL